MEHDSFFSGFSVTNNRIFPALLDIRNYLALIKRENFGSGVKLNSSQQDKLLKAISHLPLPLRFKKVMEKMVLW